MNRQYNGELRRWEVFSRGPDKWLQAHKHQEEIKRKYLMNSLDYKEFTMTRKCSKV